MTIWYVAPDSSWGGSNTGTTYTNAWHGWSNIVWGVGGFTAGDFLVTVGDHAYASTILVGAHGGTANNPATITGEDAGTITFSGASRLENRRANTIISHLQVQQGANPAIFLTDASDNFVLEYCELVGNNPSTQPLVSLFTANGQGHSDLTFRYNRFLDNVFAGAAGEGAAIQWFPTTTGDLCTLTNFSAMFNTYQNIKSGRAVIGLRAEADTDIGSVITNLVVRDEVFQDCAGYALEAGNDRTTQGLCSGALVRGLRVNNQTAVAGGSLIGGAIVLKSFSGATVDRNRAIGIVGDNGFANLFYTSAVVSRNYMRDITPVGIDGCGVLLDLGCYQCDVWGNEIYDVHGLPSTNTGFGVLVLAATDIRVYGNRMDAVKSALGFGSAGAGQSAACWNNTCINVADFAIWTSTLADLANITTNNNIFQGTGYKVYDQTALAWTGEDYNDFYGFASGTFQHTLGANDKAIDPQLDARYDPQNPDLWSSGTFLGGYDFYGRPFKSPPSMGAVQHQAVERPRALYDNRLNDATPVASTSAAGFDVMNLRDARPWTWWRPTAMPATVTVDCGSAKSCDYAALYAHDLATQGCAVEIRASTDNFSASDVLIISNTPLTDAPIVLTFASASYRYWRFTFTGSAVPTVALAMVGAALVLPVRLPSGFDPLGRAQMVQANRSEDGHALGQVITLQGWRQDIALANVTGTWLRATWVPAWQAHLRAKPFLFAWDIGAHPEETYLVAATDAGFSSPTRAGDLADLRVTLEGVAL